MSRLAREHPDDPEMWANPPVHANVPRRCWCGRGIGEMSTCGCCCTEHDHPEEVQS